ncbi:MAG: 3-isopropylmalate dehydrogenase [Alphaproteobacteria bacterium]|nr:3-isopropylmalate dehydrogenase [Alphaproteobacteria bacterium]
MSNRKIMIMPGDGIGPEVMDATMKVADWLAKHRSFSFDTMFGLCGGASYEKHGEPITDETMADVMACDAILFGAAGDPRYDNLPFELKPERGLLRMRKELDLYANLRPALVFPPLVSASTLKEDVISGLDIMIVRELTGGSYFAEPRGREERDGVVCAYDTNLYSIPEIERIGRVAFDLARKRNKKITSVEKANVMHSGVLWRETMNALYQSEGAGLNYENMYADNCAMQLVRQPKQFDVIVTDNLFGDLLSDCAAMLTGSLGMLPSASLGEIDPSTGVRRSFYEPVHGSAPDIAGKGLANPLAQLLSFAMMLRYSFDMAEDADLVEKAVEKALDSGKRTGDIMVEGSTLTNTDGMMNEVLSALDHLAR